MKNVILATAAQRKVSAFPAILCAAVANFEMPARIVAAIPL